MIQQFYVLLKVCCTKWNEIRTFLETKLKFDNDFSVLLHLTEFSTFALLSWYKSASNDDSKNVNFSLVLKNVKWAELSSVRPFEIKLYT